MKMNQDPGDFKDFDCECCKRNAEAAGKEIEYIWEALANLSEAVADLVAKLKKKGAI